MGPGFCVHDACVSWTPVTGGSKGGGGWKPLWPNFYSISYSFFGNFGKIICWRPRGVGAPSMGNPGSAPISSISYLQDDQIQKPLLFNYYNLNWKDYEYIDLNVNMSMPH